MQIIPIYAKLPLAKRYEGNAGIETPSFVFVCGYKSTCALQELLTPIFSSSSQLEEKMHLIFSHLLSHSQKLDFKYPLTRVQSQVLRMERGKQVMPSVLHLMSSRAVASCSSLCSSAAKRQWMRSGFNVSGYSGP